MYCTEGNRSQGELDAHRGGHYAPSVRGTLRERWDVRPARFLPQLQVGGFLGGEMSERQDKS